MTYPVVGMVGGGQLARMTYQAAISLDVGFRLFAESHDDSAARVARDVVIGDFRNYDELRQFATGCQVVTFDHEHVPTEHLRTLVAAGVAVRPGPDALVHAQDKAVMRARLAEVGVSCPRWRLVSGIRDVVEFADHVGWPVVLKITRGGYDGRGVWVVDNVSAAERVVVESREKGAELLAEEQVAFSRELAVLVARNPRGQTTTYPVVETVQVDGICHEVCAPAPGLSEDHAAAARQAALTIAEALDVTGVLAVEMFQTPNGVLVNELAMRPHNSGHWTIEGARTSQFEQHLRAVLDLPLGSTEATARHMVMVNVLGGAVADIYSRYSRCLGRDPQVKDSSVKIHLYGKQVRPGRKIGHVTTLGENLDQTRQRARSAAASLRGESHG